MAHFRNVKGSAMPTAKHLATSVTAALVTMFMTTQGWALEGEVREEGTNKPIAGAFVVAVWRGQVFNPVQPTATCYHMELTTTDDNGRFRLPDSSGNLNPLIGERQRYLDVYAPGYNLSPRTAVEGKFLMIRRSGANEGQFDQVKGASILDCNSSDRRLLPMYKAFHRELVYLASNDRQKRVALDALWAIETMELGEQVARRNHGARLERFMRDKEATK